jgi:hypothetical protein
MAPNRIVRQRSGFTKTKYELALLSIVRTEYFAQGPGVELVRTWIQTRFL